MQSLILLLVYSRATLSRSNQSTIYLQSAPDLRGIQDYLPLDLPALFTAHLEPLPTPMLSAARVRALLEVRAVTDPSWSAAGNHRNWAIVPADLLEREIAPCIGYCRNVTAVLGSCNEFRSVQLFVTQISTRFERHNQVVIRVRQRRTKA